MGAPHCLPVSRCLPCITNETKADGDEPQPVKAIAHSRIDFG